MITFRLVDCLIEERSDNHAKRDREMAKPFRERKIKPRVSNKRGLV